MKLTKLTDADLDGLREVANIGAGNAATALSQLLGDVVGLEVPEVQAVALGDIPERLGGAEQVLVAIHVRVFGDLRGNLLLTFPPRAAKALLVRMQEPVEELHDLPEMAASALRELGQILASTYLNAVSQVLHRSLVPSVPGLAVDMAGAVVDLLLMELGGLTDDALVLETAFQEIAGPVQGHFFLLPDAAGIEMLVQGVRGHGD